MEENRPPLLERMPKLAAEGGSRRWVVSSDILVVAKDDSTTIRDDCTQLVNMVAVEGVGDDDDDDEDCRLLNFVPFNLTSARI